MFSQTIYSAAADVTSQYYQGFDGQRSTDSSPDEKRDSYKLAALRHAVISSSEDFNKPYYYQHSMYPTPPRTTEFYTPCAAPYEEEICAATYITNTQQISQLPEQSAHQVLSRRQNPKLQGGDSLQQKFQCELVNSNLWTKFHSHTTEMIITKQGRRMFPTLQIRVGGLNPYAQYSVIVEVPLSNDTQWKYQSGKWIPSGQMGNQAVTSSSYYIHPDSPHTGAHWMKQDITFAKMKLTNNKQADPGQIVLSSMHKYQPKFIIKPQDTRQEHQVFSFPTTEFVAVTAYQNTNITQLKIDNNPFAKGFRDSYDRLTHESLHNHRNVENMQLGMRSFQLEKGKSSRESQRHSTTEPHLSSQYYGRLITTTPHAQAPLNHSYAPTYYQQIAQKNTDQYQPQIELGEAPSHMYPDYSHWYQGYSMQDKISANQQSQQYNWAKNVEQSTAEELVPVNQSQSDDSLSEASSTEKQPTPQVSSSEWIEHHPPKKRALWTCQLESTDISESNPSKIIRHSLVSQISHHAESSQDSVACH